MGKVIRLHARASAGSGGYRSGRKSCRGTPDARSTASTRKGGTSSHWQTACADTPSILPNAAGPPAALMARPKASLVSLMVDRSSIALPQSQATLHCAGKASLYDAEMTLGKRIQAARKRLRPEVSQQAVADAFGITKQAVSGWERNIDPPQADKLTTLRKILKVRYEWLLDESGAMEELSEMEQEAVDALLKALRRGRAA